MSELPSGFTPWPLGHELPGGTRRPPGTPDAPELAVPVGALLYVGFRDGPETYLVGDINERGGMCEHCTLEGHLILGYRLPDAEITEDELREMFDRGAEELGDDIDE